MELTDTGVASGHQLIVRRTLTDEAALRVDTSPVQTRLWTVTLVHVRTVT